MNSAALISPHRPLDPPVEWTLADLFAVFSRRRAWILSSLAACIGLAIAYWAFATPHYRATAVIEIQRESHGAFGLDNTTATAHPERSATHSTTTSPSRRRSAFSSPTRLLSM
jgi:uncharacterized protein involved in exopolysaccharide biosynthesis